MQTEYILKAMDAALAAGKEILNVYNDPSSDFQVERKADNSPLTLADRKAHETIMTYLQETDYPVLDVYKRQPGCTDSDWKRCVPSRQCIYVL